MSEFIEAWDARVRAALHDALTYIVTLDKLPVPDGVFHRWIRVLCALPFDVDDFAMIVRIIDKADPCLQEAGVELGNAASHSCRVTHVIAAELEPALVRLVHRDDLDPYVLEGIVVLLASDAQTATVSLPLVCEALAKIHGKVHQHPPRPIKRNRGVAPWHRLQQLAEAVAIETLTPTPHQLSYLPILEKMLGTRGWEPSVRHIVVARGLDADAYFASRR